MPQGENPAPEWKVKIMKNNKTENPGVVESVSRFAGVFVGTLTIGGKEIANYIKEITKPKLQSKPELTPKPKVESKSHIQPMQKTEPELWQKPIPEPKVSTKVAEKSVKPPAEKKISSVKKVKEKTTSRQAKVKKKVGKPKNGQG